MTDHAEALITEREDHAFADLTIGRDVGFGGFAHSTVSAGLRYADLESGVTGVFRGVPDWDLSDGFIFVLTPHTRYDGLIKADREFKGFGPVLSWDAAYPILGNADAGHLNLDWSVAGGALFGKQKATISGYQKASDFETSGTAMLGLGDPDGPVLVTQTPIDIAPRSKSATVPTAAASLGLSYEVDGFKVGAGYRWERYFNAIDGGFTEHKSFDRTIDGPYFKVSVGFGG